MMSIPELCISAPVNGDGIGTCIICGADTQHGHASPLSSSFTASSKLFGGNCACPHCNGFMKEPHYRKKSWLATQDGVVWLKPKECLRYILDPPEPPFVIYITKAGKSQGWLSNIHGVSYSKERFILHTEWMGHFWAEATSAHSMNSLIIELRDHKITKAELRGMEKMHTYKRAIEEGWDNLLDVVKQYQRQPLWEVMVHVAE